jgi:NADP-dependent 3-hydroxy acid dehydrogenase YdfG
MGPKVFDFSLTRQLSDELSHENLRSFRGDVSVEADVQQGFSTCLEAFGTIDILLNNAGVGSVTPDLSTTDLDIFEQMVNVNMQGGHIMTIISMAGQHTNPNAPLYCASKFGARCLSSGLADQAIKAGIRVTDVNLGPTDTIIGATGRYPAKSSCWSRTSPEYLLDAAMLHAYYPAV